MPRVGNQEFPYTKAGYAKAKAAAKKSGQKMVVPKKKATKKTSASMRRMNMDK